MEENKWTLIFIFQKSALNTIQNASRYSIRVVLLIILYKGMNFDHF